MAEWWYQKDRLFPRRSGSREDRLNNTLKLLNEKLKKEKVIKEVFSLEWLSNTMVVKKKNDKWRVCVDFTNLNRACPKDPFLVLKIGHLVDTTCRHLQMIFRCFLWLSSDCFDCWQQCRLDWGMLGIPTKGWWPECSERRLGARWKFTLTTW